MKFWSRFTKDRRGGFAVQTALVAPVFMMAVAGAVEYSRAYSAQVSLRNAIDSAVLSGTRMLALEPGSSDSEIVDLVRRQVQAAEVSGMRGVTCNSAEVSVDRVNVSVAADVVCTIETLMSSSVSSFTLVRGAQSEMNFDDLDVAFMLDVSGSMGGSKLTDLKDAVKEAIDIFLLNSRSNVRVALAPYSTAVNAGDYAIDATNDDLWIRTDRRGRTRRVNPGRGTQIDCVTERANTNGNAFNDEPPATEYFGRRAGWCNAAEITPLTANRVALRRTIDNYNADGMTAGHLGIAWSWYLISEKWSSFWPAASRPLADGEGRKAVVIMTDGMFNQPYEQSTNGDSAAQSLAICTEMKNAGVLVFSVGFQAPNSVKSTLRDCATTPTYFFDSDSREQLLDAYNAIAEELSTFVVGVVRPVLGRRGFLAPFRRQRSWTRGHSWSGDSSR